MLINKLVDSLETPAMLQSKKLPFPDGWVQNGEVKDDASNKPSAFVPVDNQKPGDETDKKVGAFSSNYNRM